MFNPVTDNFTNMQPPQPAVCPPAPVSVIWTNPHAHLLPFWAYHIPDFSWQDANTNYLFTFGSPGSGYFFGARVNPANSDYLDMRLEGDAIGWVAIGFTETRSMVGAVLVKLKECRTLWGKPSQAVMYVDIPWRTWKIETVSHIDCRWHSLTSVGLAQAFPNKNLSLICISLLDVL